MVSWCTTLRTMSADTKLRLATVCLYILSLVTTLVTCISLGWSVRIFTDQCPLYAKMDLKKTNQNDTLEWRDDTTWGSLVVCNFCIFGAVCGAILAITWFWFYLLLSNFKVEEKDGVKVPPDTRLLLPSMIVNVPATVVALVVACMITDGRSYLCREIRLSLNADCSVAGVKEWQNVAEGREGYNYIQVAQYGAWFWFLCVLSTVVVGGIRVSRFLREGAEHGSFSIGSYSSSSTSSLTSSDEWYTSSEDEDDVKDPRWFNNPNYNADVQKPLVVDKLDPVQEEPDSARVPNIFLTSPGGQVASPLDATDEVDSRQEVEKKGKEGKHKSKSKKGRKVQRVDSDRVPLSPKPD